MNRFCFVLFLLLGSIFSLGSSPLYGAEDWQRFLQGLQDNGQYDTAIDYLKSTVLQPSCPSDLMEEYHLQLGLVQLAQLSHVSGGQTNALLKECQENFLTFLKDHPNHDKALDANWNLGRLRLYEGEQKIERAKRTGALTDKQALQREARAFSEQAKTNFEQARELARTQIERLQSKTNSQDTNKLNRLKGLYLNLRIQLASLPANMAETWNDNSPDYKASLIEADKNLQEIFEKYGQYTGAYNARFRQVEIAMKLGQEEKAKKLLSEFDALAMNPAFYQLKTNALQLRFQLFLQETGNVSNTDKTVEELLALLQAFDDWKYKKNLPAEFYASQEGQEIHLALVRSLIFLQSLRPKVHSLQKSIRAAFKDRDSAFAKAVIAPSQMIPYAKQMLDFVRSQNSALSYEAGKLLADPFFQTIRTDPTKITPTFDLARTEAQHAWENYVRAYQDKSLTTDEAGKDKVQKTLEKAQKEAEDKISQCITLAKSDKEKRESQHFQLNLASLYFITDRFDDAIRITFSLYLDSEFSEAARAAEVHLYALRRLLEKEKTGDPEKRKELEKKLSTLFNWVEVRWVNDQTKGSENIVLEVLATRIGQLVENGKLQEVRQLLDKVPESSPHRAPLELRFGQALWSSYLRLSHKEETSLEIQSQKKGLLEGAKSLLERGMTRILTSSQANAQDYLHVYSALILAQIYMARNDPVNTIKWLNHPVIGPYPIVSHLLASGGATNQDARRGFDQAFQMATLVVMLRAQIKSGDFPGTEKTMAQLETLGSEKNGSVDQLTAIYVQVGRQIEEQLRQLNNEANSGDPEKRKELQEVSEGFERFLERLSKRQNGNSYRSLRWIADTLVSLGRGISGSLNEAPPEAIDYFVRAGRTWQTILRQIQADPNWAGDPKAELLATLRLTECLRATGRYDKAEALLIPCLKKHPNNLELQMEGARIYQSWGHKEKDYYLRAILGGPVTSTGTNTIWGWNGLLSRLSRAVNNNPRYKEIFFDAYLNKFACRYLYSRRLIDKNEIRKQTEDALRELDRLQQTYPDLGGDEFFQKFNDHRARLNKQLENTNL